MEYWQKWNIVFIIWFSIVYNLKLRIVLWLPASKASLRNRYTVLIGNSGQKGVEGGMGSNPAGEGGSEDDAKAKMSVRVEMRSAVESGQDEPTE